MKNSLISRSAVFGLLMLALVAPASAGSRKPKAKATPHPTAISAVSGNSITVTDQSSTKTVTVTQFTEITVNGQKATLADLKAGMTVSLTLSSPTQASRVTATSSK